MPGSPPLPPAASEVEPPAPDAEAALLTPGSSFASPAAPAVKLGLPPLVACPPPIDAPAKLSAASPVIPPKGHELLAEPPPAALSPDELPRAGAAPPPECVSPALLFDWPPLPPIARRSENSDGSRLTPLPQARGPTPARLQPNSKIRGQRSQRKRASEPNGGTQRDSRTVVAAIEQRQRLSFCPDTEA